MSTLVSVASIAVIIRLLPIAWVFVGFRNVTVKWVTGPAASAELTATSAIELIRRVISKMVKILGFSKLMPLR